MKLTVISGIMTMALAACSPAKQAKELWIPLFDGKTTTGWHRYNDNTIGKAWVVQDGMLHLDATAKKGWQTAEGGDIVTNDSYDNFHLKLEWKISVGGNSGIMFFVQEQKMYEHPWKTGPEMQILDDAGHADGKIAKHNAGDLYDLIKSATPAAKGPGEWNLAEIIANKGELELKLNGITTAKTTLWDDNWSALVAGSKFKVMPGFGTFKSGKIGLQDHGDDVWFRNIVIKKL
ncbi:MAG: DUF1080 domain-containing protein [Bacteroidetes bacterium]|nr:MAG: DUF1080 domain-containing protein [Bacteroidota bacterium]